MSKVTLSNLSNLSNESSAVATINSNMQTIQNAIDDLLSRDGTSPNSMEANLDMNSYRVQNLPLPVGATEPVRKNEFDALISTVTDVYNDTLGIYQDFEKKFLGAKAAAPTTDNEGSALILGALYYNTSSSRMFTYTASGWAALGSSWHYGSGVPSIGTGQNNDFYINSANGGVHYKSAGVWSAQLFTLKGADGKDGQSVRILGTLANTGLLPGSATLGDAYLISGNLWVWTGSAWTNVGAVQGPAGATGATGPAGPTGPTGAAGSVIRYGSGVPSNSLGIDGDYYLDTATSNFYAKASGAYTLAVNLKGATGATGPAGATGATGPTGPTGPAGTNGTNGTPGSVWYNGGGAASGSLGVVGDYYLDTVSYDIFQKTGTSTWTLIGNTRGTTGATGAAGTAGAEGRGAGVRYTFSSTTTKADPGSGAVRFNNATIGSVTEIYIDNIDADSNTVSTWIDTFDDSTTTANRGTLFFRVGNSAVIGLFQVNGAVVDESGYRTVPVSFVAGSLPSNSDVLYFSFARSGNVGASGSGSGDMTKSVYDPDADGKVTSAVTADVVAWSGITSKPTTLSGYGIVDAQLLDNELTALAGLTSAANKLPYFTGSGTAALTDLTATARSLLDDGDTATMRSTLGLGFLATQTTVGSSAIDNDAVTYAKIQNVTQDRILGRVSTGAGDVEEITCTAAGRALLDDNDATAQRATLGLVIGTDVQAYDADLTAIAGLTSAADRLPYYTGAGTADLATFTAAGRALLDDADAAAQRTTLGLGTAATKNIHVGTTAPTSPTTNDLWVDTN